MKVWNTRISPPRKGIQGNTNTSFSSSNSGLAKVPTKTQILHAKRRLFQFIEQELDVLSSKYSFTANNKAQLNASCVLPEEIILEILQFLDPQVIEEFFEISLLEQT
jgi:hypothetical protein